MCARAAPPYSGPERTSSKRAGLHKTRPVRRAAGGPADVIIAVTPVHPGRCPFIAWNPKPPNPRLKCPTPVVIDNPTPIGLDVVGDPIPAPFIGVDPLSVLIWTPLGRHPVRHPDFAEAWMRAPAAVLLEGDLSVLRNLRGGRRQGANDDRCGEHAAREDGTDQDCERRAT